METCHLSHKVGKSVQEFGLGAGSRKKGKNRTVKRATKWWYFGYLGESPPPVPIKTKICTKESSLM